MQRDYSPIFCSTGPLARAIPGYAFRREQAEMADAVGNAIAAASPLIIEAGTGIGKTFAYLVPVLLSHQSAIISTGTRTLQDQLFHRDIPELARAIGLPLKLALLKGRANYLCRHRLDSTLTQRSLLPAPRGARRHLNKIRSWAATTKRGELSELDGIPEDSPILMQLGSTRESCLGARCPQFAGCHVYEARRAAQAADVVIVNHHVLFADLSLKEEGYGDLLPGADAVVVDEAHQLPDIALQFLGLSWSSRQGEYLARDALAELGVIAQQSRLADALNALAAAVRRAGALAGGGGAAQEKLSWEALPDDAHDLLQDFESAFIGLAEALEVQNLSAGAAQCAQRARELASKLTTIRSMQEFEGLRWLEFGQGSMRVRFTPFEIAGRMRAFVQSRRSAWIFTSATLALGDDFSHFAARIGLADAPALRIDSPFDYGAQARIYLPPSMPLPHDARYTQDFIDACAPLLAASLGRAFLLFTSHRALREGAAALARRFPDAPFHVLQQGQAPRDALLKQFRASKSAVLLGTGSFWEGVDVKGDALCVVAIDKLPFAAPDDPLLQARLEGIRRDGGNPFFDYQVPQAVLALKQGVGRLIRDIEDFGVIVIADPRLTAKAYGRIFMDALPRCPVITDGQEAASFLRERLARSAVLRCES